MNDLSITRETLPGGTPVFATARHPVMTDGLLLAAFCAAHRRWSACDLCSGNGLVLLGLVDRGLGGRAVGVELDAEASLLLAGAAAEGGLAGVEAVNADLRDYKSPRPFDLVTANPPYFQTGLTAEDPARATARHELACTLDDVCAAAARLLKDRGRFCMCYPPGRMATLFAALRRHSLEPKRMQLVRKLHGSAPWLLLLDSRKFGGEGLQFLPDIILPPGESVHY